MCLAGTSAILDQKTADDSKSKDFQGGKKKGKKKKQKSRKNAADAATAGLSKLDVGLNSKYNSNQIVIFLVFNFI